MPKTVILALPLVALGCFPALAQTAQEKAACRSDAMKLCAAHVGKQQEMNGCLRDNKDKLSQACRQVVEARGG